MMKYGRSSIVPEEVLFNIFFDHFISIELIYEDYDYYCNSLRQHNVHLVGLK